jgi:uncharacterized protein
MFFKTINKNIYYINESTPQVYYINPIMYNIIMDYSERTTEAKIDQSYINAKINFKYYNEKYSFLNQHNIIQNKGNTIETYRISGENVKASLANTDQVVFEVTEKCNLKCKYCGFGELYTGYDQRNGDNFDFENAKKVLAFLRDIWNSELNMSNKKPIYFGFYGGEPLLNFELVKKIVEYIKTLDLNKNVFYFNMTTNGTLLHKYMDFLVKNNFLLAVSIDGDYIHNQYRVFHNGKSTSSLVERNLLLLRTRFPDFYNKNVGISSVFHDKSSYLQVNKYILEKFGKKPSISELSKTCIANENGGIKNLYGSVSEVYNNEISCNAEVKNYHDFYSDSVKAIIKGYNKNTFDNYSSLLYNIKSKKVPTGTCLPFIKKIYLTTKGKILPCEKINYNFFLGTFDKDGVNIDFNGIASKYNTIYDKYEKICKKCYNRKICGHCMLMVDNPLDDNVKCPKFKTFEQQQHFFEYATTYLENNPEIYSKIINQLYPNLL